MCAPVIQSVTFDATSYTQGATINATVTYTACCTGPFTVSGIDTGTRKWTVFSNDGVSTAVLQAIA